jgi:hypothetical protein
MAFLGVKLTNQDKRILEELAENSGMTVSEFIRYMIRAGHERQAVADALQEIRAAVGKMAAQKGGIGQSEDIAEIRRIVTLMAKAMPAVAKFVP